MTGEEEWRLQNRSRKVTAKKEEPEQSQVTWGPLFPGMGQRLSSCCAGALLEWSWAGSVSMAGAPVHMLVSQRLSTLHSTRL